MTHIESELGEIGLYVAALSIPADEALDGKAMPQIVDSRMATLRIVHMSLMEQRSQGLTQATTTEGVPPCMTIRATAIEEKWC